MKIVKANRKQWKKCEINNEKKAKGGKKVNKEREDRKHGKKCEINIERAEK
jgi:hypothetical protein